MKKKLLLIILVLGGLLIALGVNIFLNDGYRKSACEAYYQSFTGARFSKPHPPFDCSPYPPKEFLR